ncbi:hypothetical protein Droror1_Dr00008811 [Drosera rotundifolia]
MDTTTTSNPRAGSTPRENPKIQTPLRFANNSNPSFDTTRPNFKTPATFEFGFVHGSSRTTTPHTNPASTSPAPQLIQYPQSTENHKLPSSKHEQFLSSKPVLRP